MPTNRLSKRVVLIAGLGLCLIPAAVALCWRPIALRYHLWHLSHGPCVYRDAAFRHVLEWNGMDRETAEECSVHDVLILSQEEGKTVLAVLEPDDDGDSEVGERRIWLVDDDAAFIHVGNLHADGFKDLTGDGVPELVVEGLCISADDRTFEVLLVLSANKIMRPLLMACCEDGDLPWFCRSRPGGSPGVHLVEIGTGWKELFQPTATYRWSPEARAYLGPQDFDGEPFVRLESWEELHTFLSSGVFDSPRSTR